MKVTWQNIYLAMEGGVVGGSRASLMAVKAKPCGIVAKSHCAPDLVLLRFLLSLTAFCYCSF